ncbi:MAG: hypothetical protein PHH00_03905 [Candidatus Nanoarchaeia archaeon]|nr:hypothetical protein [Candidatus Nanoarchaeia archaeon]
MVKKKGAKAEERREEPKREDRKIPLGVKVISVIVYIGSALLLFDALVYVFYGITGESLSSEVSASKAVLFIASAIFVALAVLAFFVARGLWKGKNWARIVVVVFSILEIVMIIAAFFYGNLTASDNVLNLLSLVANGLIGGYLIFNKNAKKVFS